MPEVPLPGSRDEETHFPHRLGGGGVNGNSVGLDPENCISRCPSAWLMRIRLIIEFSNLRLGMMGA